MCGAADARVGSRRCRLRDQRARRRRPRRTAPHAARRRAHARRSSRSPRRRRSSRCTRAEVAELGYDMVLGNTFHLFIQPGPELIARDGRPARVHGLARARSSPTRAATRCSRWATARWPRRSSAGATARTSMIVSIEEEGVRFRSYLDGARALHGPGDLDGGPGRARLGHRARLRRVHALPRRARLHRRARWSAPTAGSTAAWPGTASTRPPGQLLYGIVQGGVYEDLRAQSTAYVAGSGVPRDRDRRLARPVEGADARGGRLVAARPARGAAAPPARDRRRRRPRPRGRRRASTRFDCATPTRLARHGTALVHDPASRWRLDLGKAAHRTSREPIDARLPLPGLPRAHARLPALPGPRRAS